MEEAAYFSESASSAFGWRDAYAICALPEAGAKSQCLLTGSAATISSSIMRYAVTDPKEFAKQLFKAGQQPAAWLRSAGHLRDAAEAILKHELPAEREYSEALRIADEEARVESDRNGTGVGSADIKAIAPNSPPAQLLYAYAIENVLKGLIVLKWPSLIQEHELHGELTTHDLNKLAEGQGHGRSAARTACPRSPHASVDMGGPLSDRSGTIRRHTEPQRLARLWLGPPDHADVLRARL